DALGIRHNKGRVLRRWVVSDDRCTELLGLGLRRLNVIDPYVEMHRRLRGSSAGDGLEVQARPAARRRRGVEPVSVVSTRGQTQERAPEPRVALGVNAVDRDLDPRDTTGNRLPGKCANRV